MAKIKTMLFLILFGIMGIEGQKIMVFPMQNTGNEQYLEVQGKNLSKLVEDQLILVLRRSNRFSMVARQDLEKMVDIRLNDNNPSDHDFLEQLSDGLSCMGSFSYTVELKSTPMSYGYLCRAQILFRIQLKIIDSENANIVAVAAGEKKIVWPRSGFRSRSASIKISAKPLNYLCQKALDKTMIELLPQIPQQYTQRKNSSPNNQHFKPMTVVVNGVGHGDNYQISKELAIADAFRNAVEKVAGVYLHSESEQREFLLVKDRIFAEARGLIMNHHIEKILAIPDDGVLLETRVRIRCTVSWAKTRERWRELAGVLKQKNYPEIIIKTRVNYDNPKHGGQFDRETLQIAIESIFRRAGFEILSPKVIYNNLTDDVAHAEKMNDQQLMEFLRKKYKRALRLEFDFRLGMAERGKVTGVDRTVYILPVRVQGRIIKLATNKQLNSLTRLYNHSEISPSQILHKALSKSGERFAKDMISRISEIWEKEIFEGQDIELRIENISYRQIRNLRTMLSRNPAIRHVTSKSFVGSVASLDIKSTVSTESIVDIILEWGDKNQLPLLVISKTGNKLILRME